MIEKIIAGGQTGVDMGALDAAIENNIPIGGYCPKGRINEQGEIPSIYPLTETSTSAYEERTRLNVLHSDGTLIITSSNNLSGGTLKTIDFAAELNKPYLIAYIDSNLQDILIELQGLIIQEKIRILNVAGNRESEVPGIYKKAKFLVDTLISSTETRFQE